MTYTRVKLDEIPHHNKNSSRNIIEITCEYCKKVFKDSQLNKDRGRKYCSMECNLLDKRK